MPSHRTRAQARVDEIDVSPTKLLADIEVLKAALLESQASAEDYLAALQRERAEFTNFRQRTAKEREMERGLAGVDLITKVLALADDFDRAIDSRPAALEGDAWADGIAAIDRKLRLLLDSEGVTAVEASPGSPTASSSRRSAAAIASAIGSSGPRSWPSPRVATTRPQPGSTSNSRPLLPSTLPGDPQWARSSASTSARRTPSSP